MNLFFDIETLETADEVRARTGLYAAAKVHRAIRFGLAAATNGESWRIFYDESLAHAFDGSDDGWHDAASLYSFATRADRIVTWGGEWFDFPVLAGAVGAPDQAALEAVSFDLFAEIRRVTGRWCGIEAVAAANLGKTKSMDGLAAVEHLQSGVADRIEAVATYCRGDVEKLVALYERLTGDGLLVPAIPKRGCWQMMHLQMDAETRGGTLSFYDDSFGTGHNGPGARPENVADRIVTFDADFDAGDHWKHWLPSY